MLEPVTGLPRGTIGFRAIGEVTKEDYRSTLVPDLEEKLLDHVKVRLYFEAGPEFRGYSADAYWEDARVGLHHFAAFDRVAVVSDVDWMKHAVKAFSFLIPTTVHVFPMAEEDQARLWLGE